MCIRDSVNTEGIPGWAAKTNFNGVCNLGIIFFKGNFVQKPSSKILRNRFLSGQFYVTFISTEFLRRSLSQKRTATTPRKSKIDVMNMCGI